MKQQGILIDIEGLDGSGSSTQVALFSEYLKIRGKRVLQTKEPTDNVIGGLIRGVLTGSLPKIPSDCLQFLFAADRSHHIDRLIAPALQQNIIVVIDRYLWSTVAFGGVDLDREWLLEMQKNFLKPDFSFFIKLDPEKCVERITDNRFDVELFEKVNKLKVVWNNYLWLAEKFPEQIALIDGNQSKEKVLASIVKTFEEKFG